MCDMSHACATCTCMYDLFLYMSHVVVGEKEQTNKTVNVRTRDNKVHGEHSLEDLVPRLCRLRESRAGDDAEEFSK